MITHVPRQSMPHYPGNVYLPTPAMIATNTIVNNLINTLSLYSFRSSGLCADLGQATPRMNDLHHISFAVVPARYSTGNLTYATLDGLTVRPRTAHGTSASVLLYSYIVPGFGLRETRHKHITP
jgi:hypothetical protein